MKLAYALALTMVLMVCCAEARRKWRRECSPLKEDMCQTICGKYNDPYVHCKWRKMDDLMRVHCCCQASTIVLIKDETELTDLDRDGDVISLARERVVVKDEPAKKGDFLRISKESIDLVQDDPAQESGRYRISKKRIDLAKDEAAKESDYLRLAKDEIDLAKDEFFLELDEETGDKMQLEQDLENLREDGDKLQTDVYVLRAADEENSRVKPSSKSTWRLSTAKE